MAPGEVVPLTRPFENEDRGLVSAIIGDAAQATLASSPATAGAAAVFEDGHPLSPIDTNLGYRRSGLGVFELRGDRVAFSATDGSNPQTNNRAYSLFVPSNEYAEIVAASIARRLAADDARIAEVMLTSCTINNTLLGNFFVQLNSALDLVRAHGLDQWRDAAVIGCGETPWAPVRMLAEGARRVVANDLLPVSHDWDAAELGSMIEAIRRVAPDQANQLDLRRREAAAGRATFEGLEAVGGTRFEEVPLEPQSLDFVFSTSVLEHVDQPEAVYEAVARATRPGGFVFHSVDLRDHRDFSAPLRFLELTDDEYAPFATENRLRASDHVALLERSGFRIVHLNAQGLPVGDRDSAWYDSLAAVERAVTAAQRQSYAPRFHPYDLRDLSVICIQFLAVKD